MTTYPINPQHLPDRALAATNFTQGEFEVTVLSDGFLQIPSEILMSDGTPEQLASILPRVDVLDGMVRPKTNIPLIRKGADLILIDIGRDPGTSPPTACWRTI